MQNDVLFKYAGIAAVGGGIARFVAAFVPYMPENMPLEAFYALMDICFLFGLMGAYLREAARLGRAGLGAFIIAEAGIATIVGPDAVMFGVSFYAVGVYLIGLGLLLFGAVSLRVGRYKTASIAWIASPIVSLVGNVTNNADIGFFFAGILFALGFVHAGLHLIRSAQYEA